MHTVHYSRTHKFHFSVTFSLKMSPTVLFTHLKIILLQCFLVFSFQLYPNGPLVMGEDKLDFLSPWVPHNTNVRASPVDSPNFCTVWRMNSDFYILVTYFFYPFSISFKYYFFIHSLFFFIIIYSSYIHSQQLYFSNEMCFIHNIFHNIFTRITSKSYVKSCY